MKKGLKRYTLADIVPRTTLADLFREQEESFVQESEAEIDMRLEDLEKFIGRKLTSDEQFAILDIVDEKSPKDDEGYIIDYLSFDYAWEIYQTRKGVDKNI